MGEQCERKGRRRWWEQKEPLEVGEGGTGLVSDVIMRALIWINRH